MRRLSKLITTYPKITILVSFIIFIIITYLCEYIWNTHIASKCQFLFKVDLNSIWNLFIPILLALLFYEIFDKFISTEKLDVFSRLLISECSANQFMMKYFEEKQSRFVEEGRFLELKDYYIDRFMVETKHLKLDSSIEKKLNKYRNLTQQTIDSINNWLKFQRITERHDLSFLLNKIERLRREQKKLVAIVNQIRKKTI